jgi:PEP-CTERM motif
MEKLLLIGVAAVAMSTGGAAYAAFPGVGHNPLGPELLITFSNSGVSTMLNPVYGTTDPGPYDGSDDVYFGVINNSSTPVSKFNLSSTSSPPIGEFDGDGINTGLYLNIPNNPSDSTGYGGPNAFFTNISADLTSLTVNFITPIAANGGTDIFSLESAAKVNNIVVGTPEPSTWAMMLAGFAGMGFIAYRKRGTKKILSAA